MTDKFYTRTGDSGETTLVGGHRVSKTDRRIEVNGHLDELSAILGIVRVEGLNSQYDKTVLRVQKELSGFCAEIAGSGQKITEESIEYLETEIDALSANLSRLTQFVIPGANKPSAYFHLARTVCRRAERSLVQLIEQVRTENEKYRFLLVYLNRLSNLLFVLAENAKQ